MRFRWKTSWVAQVFNLWRPMYSRLTLQTKAILFVLVVVVSALAVTGTLGVAQANRMMMAAEQSKAQARASALATACELPLAVGDTVELTGLVKRVAYANSENLSQKSQLQQGREIAFVAVMDRAGRVVARAVNDLPAWQAYQDKGAVPEGSSILVASAPVELVSEAFSGSPPQGPPLAMDSDRGSQPKGLSKSRVVGRVVIGTTTDEVRATQGRLKRMAIALIAIVSVFGGGIVYWGVSRWTRRLVRLVQTTERIAQGDYTMEGNQAVVDTKRDEIGRLSRSCENMRRAVQQRAGELLEARDNLERRVADRTAELVETNKQLQTVQTDMVQKEKMSMLGQLSAGVAHEINTPTAAIINVATEMQGHLEELARGQMSLSSLDPQARAWLEGMVPRVLAYRPAVSEASARAQRREREGEFRALDFGSECSRRMAAVAVDCGLDGPAYLGDQTVLAILEHLRALRSAASISLGSAQKIARIVKALRFYSRSGQEEVFEVDINESLENSLVILQNRMKHVATVTTQYDTDGKLPGSTAVVRCVGDISQVWTNLLNNACDAIEELHHDAGQMGAIECHTRIVDGRVEVSIANEGPPIPPENLTRIFDPFFTTKPVGKGTGLGLSICSGIVKRCSGSIVARNEPGRVIFTVSLPVANPAKN